MGLVLHAVVVASFLIGELIVNSAVPLWRLVKHDLQHCFNSGGILNYEKKVPLTIFVACTSLPGIFLSFTFEAGVVYPLMRHLCSHFQQHREHILSIPAIFLSSVPLNPHTEQLVSDMLQ